MTLAQRKTLLLAVLTGICTGILSTGALHILAENDLVPGGDRFGIQSLLTLSAGVCFGAIAPFFLKLRLGFGTTALIAAAIASVAGMALASEAAFWTYVQANDYNEENFILSYVVGSIVGASVLSGAIALALRSGDWRRIVGNCILWPTIWSAIVGAAITIEGSGRVIEWPYDFLLFCGWQVAFLAALAAKVQGADRNDAATT